MDTLTSLCLATLSGLSVEIETERCETAQGILDVAHAARRAGQIEESINLLGALSEQVPESAPILLELGIAHAELRQCRSAAAAFDAALRADPGLGGVTSQVFGATCPSPTPWETSYNFSLQAGENINNGAVDSQVIIGGLPFTLSDDLVAQAGVAATISGSISRNVPVGPNDVLAPFVSLSLTDSSVEMLDAQRVTAGVNWLRRDDRYFTQFGGFTYREFDADGFEAEGVGLNGRMSYRLSGNRLLQFSASVSSEDHRETRLDAGFYQASATYLWPNPSGSMRFSSGLSWQLADYRDDTEDLTTVSLFGSATGTLGEAIGWQLGFALGSNEGATNDPLFGVIREDEFASVTALVSFSQLETVLGQPYLGLEHRIVRSNIPTDEYERTSLRAGFTRSF